MNDSHMLYNTLGPYLRSIFGCKVYKININAGFTCPNRDGTKGYGGCIFCYESGAGDFAGKPEQTVSEQISQGAKYLKERYGVKSYIAYFQAFTNTYASCEKLDELYSEALKADGVVGIAIATRPDCISKDILELLSKYSKKTFLWVELGLQTSSDITAGIINRGYPTCCYDITIGQLNRIGIKTVTHVLFGLPGENRKDMLQSIEHACTSGTWGIKIHSMYIMPGTEMERMYKTGEYKPLTRGEYVDTVVKAIEAIPEDRIIHRITGDGPRNVMLAPEWSKDKMSVINSINTELKKRNSRQGINSLKIKDNTFN